MNDNQPDSLNTSIKTEPIVGWRAWKYFRPHFIGDMNGTMIWMPYEKLSAYCRYEWKGGNDPSHQCPVFDCGCGVHAYKEPYEVTQQWGTPIWGRVALWGKVIEHDTGYRAQFAYPLEFFIPKGEGVSMQERMLLGAYYGVPTSEKDPISRDQAKRIEKLLKELRNMGDEQRQFMVEFLSKENPELAKRLLG